ncbi:transcriptional protein SWT1 [Onthophagus taurus]|uniref:transcriptional protein SWT1 n=1 Tax=Onthophagus taurus TaxID=166361 RepID=UPI0039BE570A
MDRRILKPTRRNRDKKRNSERKAEDNVSTSTPRGSGVKRKCEDYNETPIKRSKGSENLLQPYSANDRLKRYRQALNEKKDQIVKVHKVFDNSSQGRSQNVGRSNINSPPKITINDRLKKVRESIRETRVDNICKVKEEKKFVDASILTSESLMQIPDDKSIKNKELSYNKSFLHHSEMDLMEDMDWSPIDEEQLEADIKKLRETIHSKPNPKFLHLLNENPSSPNPIQNILYIIVDTNIFISHLNLIKDICKAKNDNKLVVYVPWMVFQELDYFKDGRGGGKITQTAAKKAVTFINEMLMRKDGTLKGQTVHEALSHDFSNSNADDNILFCCLKLQQIQPKIVLLSNDKNLRSKLLIHSIEACSTETIMSHLKSDVFNLNNQGFIQTNEPPITRITTVFTNACTEIIKKELEKAYGNTVYKIVSEPPWTLQECLNYIKRFWVPVFSLIITQKQCLKTVDDLLEYLRLHKNMGDLSLTEQEEFVKITLSLCVYFKNCLSPHESLMKSCISEIQKILQ